jgi:hypothetical protein
MSSTISVLLSSSRLFENRRPSSGMSPNSGTLLAPARSSSEIRPGQHLGLAVLQAQHRVGVAAAELIGQGPVALLTCCLQPDLDADVTFQVHLRLKGIKSATPNICD